MRAFLFCGSVILGMLLTQTPVNDISTQPQWEEWPWFEETEIDQTLIRGPISILSQDGTQILTYLGFAREDAAEDLWKGPKACDGQALQFVCTGRFLGWAAFDLGHDQAIVQQVWLITRVPKKPRA